MFSSFQILPVLSVFFLSCNTNSGFAYQFQCMDESNTPVDWFVMYKLPQLKTNPNDQVKQGVAYAYITSKTTAQGWAMSQRDIGSPESMPGRTLAPLYQADQRGLMAMYNDQPPAAHDNLSSGHTKGVAVAGVDKGFWLVHSVPHFPPPIDGNQEGYSYPSTGRRYGQSFLCISLPQDRLELVGIQLEYNKPYIYSSHVDYSLTDVYPTLYKAIQGEHVKHSPWRHYQMLYSLDGAPIKSFAKSGTDNFELYEDWVTETLENNLFVESWRNERDVLPSSCNSTSYDVFNVDMVNIQVASATFTSHHDHSKWAITTNDTTNSLSNIYWVCIGDINRAVSQETRGGGTVCLQNRPLWQAFRDAVSAVEPCPTLLYTVDDNSDTTTSPTFLQQIYNYFKSAG